MTLDEATKFYRWSIVHDYKSETVRDEKIVALWGLGILEKDLRRLEELIPGLLSWTRSRVPHEDDDWLRVDLREVKTGEDLSSV